MAPKQPNGASSIAQAVQAEENKFSLATPDQQSISALIERWVNDSLQLPDGVTVETATSTQLLAAKLVALRSIYAEIGPFVKLELGPSAEVSDAVLLLDGKSISDIASILRHTVTLIKSRHGA